MGIEPCPGLQHADAGEREELCQIVLDEFRAGWPLIMECLTDDGFERLQRQSAQHLTGLWSVSGRDLPWVSTVSAFRCAGPSRSDTRMTGRVRARSLYS